MRWRSFVAVLLMTSAPLHARDAVYTYSQAGCEQIAGWAVLVAPITAANQNPQPGDAILGASFPNTSTNCGSGVSTIVTLNVGGPQRTWLQAVSAESVVSDPSNPVDITLSTADPGVYALFSTLDAPAAVDDGDRNAVELGVKFTSDVVATVTGIAFYKSTYNIAPHLGNLWSSSGDLLASATFANETPDGWQSVDFASPVSVSPGIVYVASYFCPHGHYSGDTDFFLSQFDAPPLHGPASDVLGGNGVYAYGSTSSFPMGTYRALNYWVTPIMVVAGTSTTTTLQTSTTTVTFPTTSSTTSSTTSTTSSTSSTVSTSSTTTTTALVACLPVRAPCTLNAQCCSRKCRGGGNKHCQRPRS
jgi:hypothetical protein